MKASIPKSDFSIKSDCKHMIRNHYYKFEKAFSLMPQEEKCFQSFLVKQKTVMYLSWVWSEIKIFKSNTLSRVLSENAEFSFFQGFFYIVNV